LKEILGFSLFVDRSGDKEKSCIKLAVKKLILKNCYIEKEGEN